MIPKKKIVFDFFKGIFVLKSDKLQYCLMASNNIVVLNQTLFIHRSKLELCPVE